MGSSDECLLGVVDVLGAVNIVDATKQGVIDRLITGMSPVLAAGLHGTVLIAETNIRRGEVVDQLRSVSLDNSSERASTSLPERTIYQVYGRYVAVSGDGKNVFSIMGRPDEEGASYERWLEVRSKSDLSLKRRINFEIDHVCCVFPAARPEIVSAVSDHNMHMTINIETGQVEMLELGGLVHNGEWIDVERSSKVLAGVAVRDRVVYVKDSWVGGLAEFDVVQVGPAPVSIGRIPLNLPSGWRAGTAFATDGDRYYLGVGPLDSVCEAYHTEVWVYDANFNKVDVIKPSKPVAVIAVPHDRGILTGLVAYESIVLSINLSGHKKERIIADTGGIPRDVINLLD